MCFARPGQQNLLEHSGLQLREVHVLLDMPGVAGASDKIMARVEELIGRVNEAAELEVVTFAA